ncbi:hypothetical protein [Paraeggerthella sp.]|uniref:hypothetical protein n=1 Tax=Paraeggerthella sp. TaxID=2897350 RepID=UPI003A915D1C
MKVTKDKVTEWSLGSIVGSIVLAILTGIVTVYTGSWDVVAPFVAKNKFDSVMCASFVLALGIAIGASVVKLQNAISRRKLRSAILALPGESKAMLEWLHREGDVSTVNKQSNARMMHLMGWGMVGMVEKTISLDDSIGDTWMVVPRVSKLINKDSKVSEDLDKAYFDWYEDAELLGRIPS